MNELSERKKSRDIYYYDPQSSGINVQSPQSESTPRRLTLASTYVLECFWQHQHRDEGYIQWQWQTAASKARKSQISALRLLVLSLAGHAVQTAVRRANHGLNFARRPSALARRGQA